MMAAAATINTAASTTTSANDPVLFGDQTIESGLDENAAGLPEAFPFANAAPASASSIAVYVDSLSQATKLVAGLYADQNGAPGALIVAGSLSSPKGGAWNTVTIAPTAVQSGKYWLAVLGQGGTMYFRDRSNGPCYSQNTHSGDFSQLPSSWSAGPTWNTCPISAYVAGALTNPVGSVTPAPVNNAAPSVSGSTVAGGTLKTTNGSWSNSPTTYSYAWEDCDSTGNSCTKISNSSSSGYILTGGDAGHTIRSAVTATNSGGSASASSAATPMVQPAATLMRPSMTSAPAITGTTMQGDALTVSNGTWSGDTPMTYTYQWQDCASSCTKITGGTGQTYTLQSSDVGYNVDAIVTVSNDAGNASMTSNSVGPISASSASSSSSCASSANTPGGPDPFGGCFPGNNNTGVPAGTALTNIPSQETSGMGWSWSTQDHAVYVTSCGVTLSAVHISGWLVLKASASNATHSASTPCVTVTDSEIDGIVQVQDTDGSIAGGPLILTNDLVSVPSSDMDRSPVLSANYYATGLNVEGGRLGFSCRGYCSITDSYVHAGYLTWNGKSGGGFHYNAIGSNGLSGPLTIEHDSLSCDFTNNPATSADASHSLANGGGCSDDVGLFGDFGPIQNVTIDKNLFVSDAQSYGGVPFCLDGGGQTGKPYSTFSNESVTNNVFQRGVPPGNGGSNRCGLYGPLYAWVSGNGNVWSGDTWDNGSVLAAG